MAPMTETARPYAPTALPSVTARLLAFLAILVGGLCGGLIGWSVTDLQCGSEGTIRIDQRNGAASTSIESEPASDTEEECTGWKGAGGLAGAVVGAGGTGVVAVLVLRAMAEWRRDLDVDEAPDAA